MIISYFFFKNDQKNEIERLRYTENIDLVFFK